MTEHKLKIHPQYYSAVASGQKTFEVRENDRGFQPGDTVHLHEWEPEREFFTKSPVLSFKIGYVLPLEHTNKVVFSLLRSGDLMSSMEERIEAYKHSVDVLKKHREEILAIPQDQRTQAHNLKLIAVERAIKMGEHLMKGESDVNNSGTSDNNSNRT